MPLSTAPPALDYLIVGQGLAGTLLAHHMRKAGKRFRVIGHADPESSSMVAAGIVNPLTGRRYAKSWRIDELIPFAAQTYAEISALLNFPVFIKRPILRAVFTAGEENDWLSHTADPGYAGYMEEVADGTALAGTLVPPLRYGGVLRGGQVQVGALVEAYRKLLLSEGCYEEGVFDYQALELRPEGVRYKGLAAQRIVFCEGSAALHNPLFGYLPLRPAKGEVLLVRIPGAHIEAILKHKLFIVPWAEDTYWVGSTYYNRFDTAQPTQEGRLFLEGKLQEALTIPFEVIAHRAAVRPTVIDRRPLIGSHPTHANCFIFNGLGTKGASLVPYWAAHLMAHLEAGAPLDEEVSVRRFDGRMA